MQKPKSKAIFFILAVLAVAMMVLFSVFIAEGMALMSILTVVVFVGIFGVGFTLKKKYRENGWL
jgi:polyferredoxin